MMATFTGGTSNQTSACRMSLAMSDTLAWT